MKNNRLFEKVSNYWLAGLLSATLFALLIASAGIPPVTDLPQHLAQVRLFNELMGWESTVFDRTDYQINWLSPNTLVYLPLWMLQSLFGAIGAGRLAMYLLALGWTSSIIYLARKRDLPVAHALLASVFVLNLSFYWGFINFLFGFPFFVLWIARVTKEKICDGNLIWLSSNCVFLAVLLWCHSLWYLIAASWYGLYVAYLFLNKNLSLRRAFTTLLPLAPTLLISLIWFPELKNDLADAGFRVVPIWEIMPLDRLSITNFTNYVLGGLQGPMEVAVVCITLIWMALCICTNWNSLLDKIDRKIAAAALLLWGLFLFGPDFYMNTMYFAQRWASPAIMLSVMALPSPNISRSASIVPTVLFIAFLSATSLIWLAYDEVDLDGLEESLASIPDSQKVMWLSFEQSPRFKHPPFLQIGAWSQAMNGSEVNFSFAELGTGIVTLKKPRRVNWTRNLEWYPTMVKEGDIKQFDYVLIKGRDGVHKSFVSEFGVPPSRSSGGFRIYGSERNVSM